MKQFSSIQKLDTGILYALELTSSFSVFLKVFGLIVSMVNVLTKGTLFTDNGFMQSLYAWSQCIGIDASIPGAIMRTVYYYRQKEWSKAGVYTLLSALLLFTACLVSNIESIQQTLNITLSSAYQHVFLPIEGLIWIRSVTIVLLVVVHAIRHINIEQSDQTVREEQQQLALTPELIEAVRSVIVQEIQAEQKALPDPDNYERVKVYIGEYPQAKVREIAQALSMSPSTASKWMRQIEEESK
ncbi:hypothetical protein KSF_084400 [Reticulibacter mediterranei]|uniref:Uncharacterized protein n=1 Tax=Reticulibacter mediterranei TaxID=2778369 RepID=A0A8J3N4N4_9CHLR|nr:hypothetical protein [Reticulibacter mediterranei]GHO98392.1 hypothetical protein KSF_084400 [Reticulibacter mediterranei]